MLMFFQLAWLLAIGREIASYEQGDSSGGMLGAPSWYAT